MSLHVEGPLPAACHLDSERCCQVATNLLGNALKFVAADGSGAVRLEVEFSRETALLVLRVVDNGRGMTPEGMGRIFRPFQQAEGEGARAERDAERAAQANMQTAACVRHSRTFVPAAAHR